MKTNINSLASVSLHPLCALLKLEAMLLSHGKENFVVRNEERLHWLPPTWDLSLMSFSIGWSLSASTALISLIRENVHYQRLSIFYRHDFYSFKKAVQISWPSGCPILKICQTSSLNPSSRLDLYPGGLHEFRTVRDFCLFSVQRARRMTSGPWSEAKSRSSKECFSSKSHATKGGPNMPFLLRDISNPLLI